MNVVADISVNPLGVGPSTSEYIASCVKILRRARLDPRVHAFGTNVEGPWERVFDALQECHRTVHAMGAPRVSTTVQVGTRVDRQPKGEERLEGLQQGIRRKIRRVEHAIQKKRIRRVR